MSFTSIVKNEVSKLDFVESEKITELSAIVRTIGVIDTGIHISTENASVARRIFQLIKDIYHISPKITVRRGYNFNRHYIYILEIHSYNEEILKDLSIDVTSKENLPNSYLYDDPSLVKAYLRGAFLGVGSINDPKKSRYHLEFLVDNESYAKFLVSLLNQFYLHSKVIKRDNKYMIYMKEAEKIGDFLRLLGTYNALFYYEDIRIYRDHKNMTNRLNNCEQANVDKTIASAMEQVSEIEFLQEVAMLDLLDEKSKEAALYRLKYPESSLQELSEIISLETGNSITKSGLHHRFRKIKELVNRLQKKENNE